MANILTVDVSTQSTTAAAFDSNGRKHAVSTIPHMTCAKGFTSEQDPRKWWKNVLTASKTVLESDKLRNDVAAVVADGTPYSVIPVDTAGVPLTKAIIYTDKRAQQEAKDIGNEFKKLGRYGHTANPTHPIPKILWIKRNLPEVYEKTHQFLSSTSYLNFRLTGEYFTDVWENFRRYGNPRTGTLPEELLNNLDIGPEKFPKAYPIGSKTYPIDPEVARSLGLPPKVRVVLATNDSGLVVIGSGISKPGDTSLSFGTAAVLKTLTGKRISCRERGIWPQPALQKGRWIIGGYEMAGSVLEWYRRGYYADEPRPYDAMDRDARKTPPGANGTLFKPSCTAEDARHTTPTPRPNSSAHPSQGLNGRRRCMKASDT